MNDIVEHYANNLPEELKWSGCFCGWRLINGIKLLFDVRTRKAGNAAVEGTFVSFYYIRRFIKDYYVIENGKQLGGIGIGLFYGISAIDIDHCVEHGVPNDMAQDIIDHCKSYTEFSPSGTGIRIIFKSKNFYDKNKYYLKNQNHGLEIYVCGMTKRYLTITGNKYKYDTLEEVDLTYVLENYMKRPTTLNSGNDDFSKALQNDAKLHELWIAQAPGSGANESELDMALISKIAFYTKCDPNKTRILFETSPYFASKDEKHKQKWNDGYHAEHTIDNAINFVRGNIISKTMSTPPLQMPKHEEDLEIVEQNPILKGTDLGNAELFAKRFKGNIMYNFDAKKWMIWNNKYWQYDVDGQVRVWAKEIANIVFKKYVNTPDEEQEERKALLKNARYLASSRGIDNMIKEAMSLLPCINSDFNKNPYLLCCENGYVDMQTGDLLPFNKNEKVNYTTGYDIDLEHEPNLFIKTLKEILSGNEDNYHYIQKALGYSFTGDTAEQCMFILQGDGNNGKSLILELLLKCAGAYGISSKPTLLMENRFGATAATPEETARLAGKRFIVISEPKMNDKFDESVVKRLTSGNDRQVARYLYANSFEFLLKAKMWMATNYEPIIRGTDKGIWRRVRKIDITADFTDKEDKYLLEKLVMEIPQILGWIVKGYLMYRQEGLKDTKNMEVVKKEYKEKMDITARWAEEECEFDDSYYSTAKVLYNSCKEYARKYENYELSFTAFGRMMGKKYRKDRFLGQTTYYGLRLKVQTFYQTEREKKENFKNANLFNVDSI